MIIELSADEKEFIIKLLQKTSVQRILDRLQSSSTVHPDHKDFIECELTISELEGLIGELSYEANHNRKKSISMQACDIADGLEHQLRCAQRDGV
jgi:hypothetical protein